MSSFTALDLAIQDLKSMKDLLAEARDSVRSLGNDVLETYSGDDAQNLLETLKTSMVDLIEVEMDVTSLDSAAEMIKQLGEGEDLKTRLQENFDATRAEQTEPQDHRAYKDLLHIIGETRQQTGRRTRRGDTDLSVGAAEEPRVWKDPITQANIRVPVKNTLCGHIYDKDSIRQYISTTRHPRCPFVGCNNKTSLLRTELVDDLYILRKIQENSDSSA